MSDAILPALFIFSIKWKAFHDELINPIERDFLVGCVLDGHRDEGNVGIWRLDHVFGRGCGGGGVVSRGVGGVATHGRRVALVGVGAGACGRVARPTPRMSIVRIPIPKQCVHLSTTELTVDDETSCQKQQSQQLRSIFRSDLGTCLSH